MQTYGRNYVARTELSSNRSVDRFLVNRRSTDLAAGLETDVALATNSSKSTNVDGDEAPSLLIDVYVLVENAFVVVDSPFKNWVATN